MVIVLFLFLGNFRGAIVVTLSTLFTGQHNLPDPIGGIIWAFAGYRFGWWWVKRTQARRKEG